MVEIGGLYLVLDCGDVGFAIASRLTKRGAEVAIVDRDASKVEQLKELGYQAFLGDFSSPEVLMLFLLESVRHFEKVVKMTWDHTDPLTSKVSPYTKNQTNFLIRAYNDVIRDLQSHLEKRDAYVREFSTFEELDDPPIDEVAGVIYKMGTIILQIISYLIRWME